MYGIIVMVILLPVWILTEGFKKLSSLFAKKGWHWDALYVLIIILSFLAIALFLFSR